MKWLNKKIVRKLFLLQFFMIVIILSFNSLSMDRQAGHFFKDQSYDFLYQNATILQKEIDAWLQSYLTLIEAMSVNEDYLTIIKEVDNRNEKREHELYNRVTEQLLKTKALDPNISLVYLGLAEASDIITDRYDYDTRPDYFLRGRRWYQESLLEKKAIITSPYIDFVTGEMVVSISKIIWGDNEDLGAVAIDLKINDIYQFLNSYQVGENGYPLLLSNNGDIIYHPNLAVLVEPGQYKLEEYYPFNRAFLNNQDKKVLEFVIDDTEWFASYVSLETIDWVLMTMIPKEEIMAPIQALRSNYIFLFIGFLIITCLISLVVSKQMAYPIRTITRVVNLYDHKKEVMAFPKAFYNRADELGDLIKGLQNMSSTITQYTEEIQDKNEELLEETKVRKKAQNRLQLILQLLAGTRDATFIVSEEDQFLYANEAFTKIIQKDEIALSEMKILQSYFHLDLSFLQIVLANSSWKEEVVIANNQNEEQLFHLTLHRLELRKKIYFLGYLKDMTQEKKQEETIFRLRNIDALTNLYTGHFLQEYVQNNITENPHKKSTLILIDIRGFRLINEAKGHRYGNQVLIQTAQILNQFTESEAIAARLSADEFAVFIPFMSSKEQIVQKVNELSLLFRNRFIIEDEEAFVDVIMGVSLYPDDGKHYESLFSSATSALNHAKANINIPTQYYNKDLNLQSIYRYELQKKMYQALEDKSFFLEYQPQVDMNNGKIIGAEALVRLNTEDGRIPPYIFVPIAEETGMIIPLGEWILKEACQLIQHLSQREIYLPVSVNLSALQFSSPYLIQLIERNLKEYDIPANLLELEITEGILMNNETEGVQLLKELSSLGVSISIDDFGTGYSSLAYLKKFPVDKIKIDRSFIKDIPTNDDGVIAKVIIELSNALGLEVVAEGVETVDQIQFLIKEGCRIAQGFHYFKPLSKENLLLVVEKTEK